MSNHANIIGVDVSGETWTGTGYGESRRFANDGRGIRALVRFVGVVYEAIGKAARSNSAGEAGRCWRRPTRSTPELACMGAALEIEPARELSPARRELRDHQSARAARAPCSARSTCATRTPGAPRPATSATCGARSRRWNGASTPDGVGRGARQAAARAHLGQGHRPDHLRGAALAHAGTRAKSAASLAGVGARPWRAIRQPQGAAQACAGPSPAIRVAKEPGPRGVLPAAAGSRKVAQSGRGAQAGDPRLNLPSNRTGEAGAGLAGVGRYPNRADSRRGPCAPVDAARLPER